MSIGIGNVYSAAKIGLVSSFHVHNFGCRASQADGAAIESALVDQGMCPAGVTDADLVVLNTCTVTALADEDVRKAVHRVHRENPEARILVTGCYAQRAPEELAVLPGVYWVVGNSHKVRNSRNRQRAGCTLSWQIHVGEIRVGDIFATARFSVRAGGRRRRRSHAPQPQDPGWLQQSLFVLHHSVRARPQPQRARRTSDRRRCGIWRARYREVVLSGINLGRWGREPGSSAAAGGPDPQAAR